MGFNNPDTNSIWKVCGNDPRRGNQYSDTMPLCEQHAWFGRVFQEMELNRKEWCKMFESGTFYVWLSENEVHAMKWKIQEFVRFVFLLV